jgi:hypothetical protein
MLLNDRLANRQPQPGASPSFAAIRVGLPVFLEDSLLSTGGDARTVIDYLHLSVVASVRYFDFHLAAVVRKLYGIGQQIDHYLHDPVSISQYPYGSLF